MATLFTKIVNGEIPCHKIAENETCLAFLDIQPLTLGHVLVIPKVEIDYVFDLDDAVLSELVVFSKQIAKAIKLAYPCLKVGVAVIGLEVPHAHIHLVPMNEIADLDFKKVKLKPSYEELASSATKIRSFL